MKQKLHRLRLKLSKMRDKSRNAKRKLQAAARIRGGRVWLVWEFIRDYKKVPGGRRARFGKRTRLSVARFQT